MAYFIVKVLLFLELSNLNINYLFFVKDKKGKHTKFVGYWRDLKDGSWALPPPQTDAIVIYFTYDTRGSIKITIYICGLLLNLFQHVPTLIVPSSPAVIFI